MHTTDTHISGPVLGRLAALVMLLALSVSSTAAERIALVIGNETYAERPLENPVNDAEAMSAKEMELARAAERSELQTMERLIAEGVSADAKDGDGYPALLMAARGGHLDALKLLRRHGANLDATNSGGGTALMMAVINGKADCAEALLEWGADKDAADKNGYTALHQAAYRGQLECARLLVRARADRAKKNNKGQTALEVARQEGKAEVAALLEQADADVSDSTPLVKKRRVASKTSCIKGACVPPCVVRRCNMRR